MRLAAVAPVSDRLLCIERRSANVNSPPARRRAASSRPLLLGRDNNLRAQHRSRGTGKIVCRKRSGSIDAERPLSIEHPSSKRPLNPKANPAKRTPIGPQFSLFLSVSSRSRQFKKCIGVRHRLTALFHLGEAGSRRIPPPRVRGRVVTPFLPPSLRSISPTETRRHRRANRNFETCPTTNSPDAYEPTSRSACSPRPRLPSPGRAAGANHWA